MKNAFTAFFFDVSAAFESIGTDSDWICPTVSGAVPQPRRAPRVGRLTLREMATLGKCTACKEDALADAHGHPFLHPKLGVLLCERCHGRGRG